MSMLNLEEIKCVANELGNSYGADRIYLFGSYARGDANDDSDIDLRIDKGKIIGLISLAGLKLDLEDRLGKKVDLLTSDSLDIKFLDSIKNEEVLLYVAD